MTKPSMADSVCIIPLWVAVSYRKPSCIGYIHPKHSVNFMYLTESSLHFRWIFLELLGYISFFGVLMIQAQSYQMAITMCMLTVFSISLFCYVLADFDSPLHGLFRIDLNPLVSVIFCLNSLHVEEKKNIKSLNK